MSDELKVTCDIPDCFYRAKYLYKNNRGRYCARCWKHFDSVICRPEQNITIEEYIANEIMSA